MIDKRREYWGRVHDMVDAYNSEHGTNVKPWECSRTCGLPIGQSHPSDFDLTRLADLEFAVAILDGKPLFLGDTVYCKTGGYKLGVCDANERGILVGNLGAVAGFVDPSEISLNPPKKNRTFTLNGVELPCPVKNSTIFMMHVAYAGIGTVLNFESFEDSHQWKTALDKIFDEALNKE